MVSNSTFTNSGFGLGDMYMLQSEKEIYGECQKYGSQLCYDIVSQVSSCYGSLGPLFNKCYCVQVVASQSVNYRFYKNIYRRKEF